MLYVIMKKFQNQGGGPDTSSDMIGKTVPSSTEISKVSGKIRFSGIDWNARLDETELESIQADQSCVITGVDGNTMIVKKEIQGEGFDYISSDYYETQVIRVGYSYKF